MNMLKSSLKMSVLTALTVLALLAMIYSISFGGWKAMSVQTGSMRPAIDPGDLVLMKKVPASSIKIGDVITYTNPADPKQTVTHRVLQIIGNENGPKSFIVRGDANPNPDPAVPQSNVLGRVDRTLPFLGHAVDFVRQPIGLILIIYIPALSIIISEIRRLAQYYKSQRPYLAEGYTHHSSGGGSVSRGLIAIGVVGLGVLIAIPVKNTFALLQASASLTGNTITVAPKPPKPPDPEPPQPPPSNCTVTNNNSVNVNNNSSQTATTGDATNQNNTSSESAETGNASNTNSTNVNVQVNNQNPCPQQ